MMSLSRTHSGGSFGAAPLGYVGQGNLWRPQSPPMQGPVSGQSTMQLPLQQSESARQASPCPLHGRLGFRQPCCAEPSRAQLAIRTIVRNFFMAASHSLSAKASRTEPFVPTLRATGGEEASSASTQRSLLLRRAPRP